MSIFDLNNPLKPTPIPTKPGRWHKADTAFEDKHIPVESPIHSISRVQSAAAIRKFGLFYPGIENEKKLFIRTFLLNIDPSNKNVKYYSKLALSWICGVEHQGEADNKAAATLTMPPLAPENPFWKHICNINAVIILAFCAFLWAFFTDYRIDKMYKSS